MLNVTSIIIKVLVCRKAALPRWEICILSLSFLLFAASTTVFAGTTDARLDVQLELYSGYLVADPAKAKLEFGSASSVFEQECGLSVDEIKEELTGYLNRLLHDHGTVLEQRVFPAKKAELEALRETRKDVDWLNGFTGKWIDAEKVFREWANDNPDLMDKAGLADVYDNITKDLRHKPDGPLIPLDPENLCPPEDPRALFLQGRLLFDLAAPITKRYRRIQPESNVDEWKKLRGDLSDDILGSMECKLWYRGAVIDPIVDYLEMRGIAVENYRRKEGQEPPPDKAGISPEQPLFTASGASHNRVIISPDPLLEGVVIGAPPSDGERIHTILYLLLPSPDYLKVKAKPADFLCLIDPLVKEDGGDNGKASKHVFLPLRSGPSTNLQLGKKYMTRRFLTERLRHLGEMGYKAQPGFPRSEKIPSQTGENKTLKLINLLVSPVATNTSTGFENSRFASLQDCNSQGVPSSEEINAEQLEYDRGKSTLRSETLSNEKYRRDKPSQDVRYSPERPNEFRIGVEKISTKPFKSILGFTRTGLTDGNDILSTEFGYQDKPSGDLQYTRDFVAFEKLERRLQMSLRGFSDFTPDRSLSMGRADERRTGGEGRAKVDLWRDWEGHWAQLDLGVSWRESRVEENQGATVRRNITHLDSAVTYFKAWDGTPGSGRLELSPSFILGETSDTDAWFVKPAINGHFHRFISSYLQWDLRGVAVATAGSAPEVELPTFGGEDSVRGYKPDAALAKTVWALQNEVWFPVRLPLRIPSDLGTFLRRNVAAALFVDVGGAHDSLGPVSGVRGGVGTGIRLVWKDYLTFRLDWAYPLSAGRGTGSGGQLFFTVTTWPGF